MPFPSWLRTAQVNARAVWDAREELPGHLAGRIADQLAAYDEFLGPGDGWTLTDDDRSILPDPATLALVLSAHVYRDAEGVAFPARGYILNVYREGSAGHLALRFRVGSARAVKRMPSNTVQITIAGPLRDGERLSIDSDLVEGVLRGLVSAWDPDSAAVYDDDAAVAAEGRGKFAPVIGQRTWVSDRLGIVQTSTSRVRVQPGNGGRYLIADETLDSASAVDEVWASLQANDVTEIHRAVSVR